MLGAKERHWEKQAKARDKNNREKRCLPAAKQDARVTASPDSCGRLGLHQQKLPDCLGSLPSCTRPDLGQTPWMCKALADLIHQSSAAAGLLSTTVSSGLLQFCDLHVVRFARVFIPTWKSELIHKSPFTPFHFNPSAFLERPQEGEGSPIHCQTAGLRPGWAGIRSVCCTFEMIPSEGFTSARWKDLRFPSSDAIERGISWRGLVVQLPVPPTFPSAPEFQRNSESASYQTRSSTQN